MKKGFTLIELLIVIGIIGILGAVMLNVMGGAGDSAQAAKCLANMKNLSTAILATKSSFSTGSTKIAKPLTEFKVDYVRNGNKATVIYSEVKGWISCDTENMFPATSKPNIKPISCYESNDDKALFAITNGAIWAYMNGNSKCYCCPLHAKKRPNVHWSYLMNARFRQSFKIANPEQTLLLSEIPFQGPTDGWNPGESETDTDAMLQYRRSANAKSGNSKDTYEDGNEHIGANHKNGKNYMAHVSFLDGHVEKLRIGGKNLQELTTFLCEGTAYTLESGKYVELK